MDSTVAQQDTFKMEGTLKRFLMVYSGAFFIGVVLLYIFVIMLIRTEHLILLVYAVPLYAYAFGDLFIWMRNGIRSVVLDSSGLTIARPHDQTPVHVEADQITGVYVSKFIDRTTIHLVLRGGTVRTFLGFRLYSGPNIRITNEPYDKVQFLEFTRQVRTLGRVANDINDQLRKIPPTST